MFLQVCTLQHSGHQTESTTGRSLQQPWECVQGARTATRSFGELPSCCATETRFYRRLHQSGCSIGGCWRHGTGSPGLCYSSAVQSGKFTLCMSFLLSFLGDTTLCDQIVSGLAAA